MTIATRGEQRPEAAFPLNQPILVDRTGEHTDTMHAVAQASLGVYLDQVAAGSPDLNWLPWLTDGFAKVVRRTSPAALAQAHADPSVLGTLSRVGTSAALALAPMAVADQPAAVAKGQVAGTDMPRLAHRSAAPSDGIPVHLLVLDTLTTGKACAQAAHALWLWALSETTREIQDVLDWYAAGALLHVKTVSARTLDIYAAAGPTDLVVRDAGRSEVASGTVTAVAMRARDVRWYGPA